MSAQLRVIQGDHKVSAWNREISYRAKVAIPNGGFVSRMDYVGSWRGWKRIDPDATVVAWSAKR